jgi:hypothetical protein
MIEIRYKLLGGRGALLEAEAAMVNEELVDELASLEFEAGYEFENGKPFYETLGHARAKGLLKALEDRGLALAPSHAGSVSGSHEDTPSQGASFGSRSS